MKPLTVLVFYFSALQIFGFRIEYTGDSVKPQSFNGRFQNIFEDHTELPQIETTATNEYNANEEITGKPEDVNETLTRDDSTEQRQEIEDLFQINLEDTAEEVDTTTVNINENLVQYDNEAHLKEVEVDEINEGFREVFDENQPTTTISEEQPLDDRAGANLNVETSTQYPKASTFSYENDPCDDFTEENRIVPSESPVQEPLARISNVENESIPISIEDQNSPASDDEAGEEASKNIIGDIIPQSRQFVFPSEESEISTSTENESPPSISQSTFIPGDEISTQNQEDIASTNEILNQPYFGTFGSNVIGNNVDTVSSTENPPQTSSESDIPDQTIGTDITSTTTIKYDVEDKTISTQEPNKIIPTGFSTAGIPIFSTNTFNNFGTVPTTETTSQPSSTPIAEYQENFGKLSLSEDQQNLFSNRFYQGNLGTITNAPSTTKYQNNFGTTIFENQPSSHRFGFGTRFNGFTFDQPGFKTTTLKNDITSTTLNGFNFTPTPTYTDTPVSRLGLEVTTNRNPFTSSQKTSVIILNEPSTVAPPFTTSTQTTLDTNVNNQYDLFTGIQTTQPELTSTTFTPPKISVTVTPPGPSIELFSKVGDQEYRIPPTMDRGKITLSDEILPPKEGESTTEGLVQALFSGQITFDNSSNTKPRKGSFFNIQNLGGFNLVSVSRNTVPATTFHHTAAPPLPTPPRPIIQKPRNERPQFSLGIINRYTSSNLKIDTVNLGKTGSINRFGDSTKTMFFNGLHLYNPSFAKFLK
ncbi:hypothetical protein Trydic_g18585 [Trypoxylus dichotomus]